MFYVVLATVISWTNFFSTVTPQGVEFSEQLHRLNGSRVVLRGYSVTEPRIEGGILLTRFPYTQSPEVEECDVPFDAVAVIWRRGIDLPPIPRRPTVEGTLRLGNREHSGQAVMITLEEAVPVVPDH